MTDNRSGIAGDHLVSVIIPTYNRATLVVETIDCCLNQTHGDLEVIVVDDGSTDSTIEILNEYQKQQPAGRFKYLSQRNMGPSAARNAGLDIARGSYVKFLDSDDTLEPEAFAFYIDALKSAGADLCIGSRRYMSPEGEKNPIDFSPPAGRIECELEKFFDLELRPQTGHWFFRMDIFRRGLRWDTQLLAREDTDLLGNILAEGLKVAGAPRSIYNQRWHRGPRQTARQFERDVFRSIHESNTRLYEKLRQNNLIDGCGRSFARSMSRTALRAWEHDSDRALDCYALAKKAYRRPELVLLPSYPLSKTMRKLASALWLVGGVRLCGPLFYIYARARKHWRG